MIRTTESHYHTLANERGFDWLGPRLPKSNKKKTLWGCSKKHIFPRTYGNLSGPARECPICNGGNPRLVDEFPEQVAEYFDPERNPNIKITFIMSGSNKSIEWYCQEHDNQWPAPPYSVCGAWSAGRSGCRKCWKQMVKARRYSKRHQEARIKLPKTSVLKKLYEQLSLQEIADKFGASRWTLRKVLVEAGIEIKPRSHRRR